jgi:alpha-mannosidase
MKFIRPRACLPILSLVLSCASVIFPVAIASAAGGQSSAPAAGRQPSSQAPGSFKLEVIPTPFFIREGGALKQMVRVLVENAGPETRGEVRVTVPGSVTSLPLDKLPQGKSELHIYIPEIRSEAAAAFELRADGRSASVERRLVPERHWTIYLFHHSHTDIGYTELQTRIYKNHADYLDDVIKYCRETDNYPDDAKFRWNIEVSWALQNYMRHRPESRVKELLDLVRQGRVEIGAWYLQLSDLFAHEELIRATEFASELRRKYDLPISCAMNDDVTGWSWASPQVLRGAGIRYFATGINETRSRAALRRPCPFYWESPDGSRILHWNGEHYLFANYELRLHEGEEKSAPLVEKYLSALEARGDYPYDLIAFNISAWVTDNCPPGRKLSDVVRDWNRRWAFPKLRLAVLHEFFQALEEKYGPSLPVYKLGWPDYWTDGAASTAFETGLNRLAHNELLTAEKAGAIASALDPSFDYPAGELAEGQEHSMFYDEHTWGAWNSIDEPDSELARGQWAIKSSFAYEAREIARTMTARNLGALAARVQAPGGNGLIVFNPLSWPRTDVVRATLPQALVEKKGKFRLTDRRTGGDAAFQLVDDRTILFLARDVPSLGYAVYEIAPAAGTAAAAAPAVPGSASGTLPTVGRSVAALTLENDVYKITVDPQTGGIKSLFDKRLEAECVDAASPYTLNQYIYENPVGGRKAVDNMEKRAAFKRWSPTSVKVTAGMNGPVARSIKISATAPGCRSLETEIVLYEGVDRVDIVNRLDKEDTRVPEAVYFAFPFKVDQGTFVFEIADGMMRPETDQLPGSSRDWLTAQQWVEAANAVRSVVWSPVEAPLIQFDDINTGKWLKKLEIPNATVFSYAMNNYWMTNFKASQGGLKTFRYALASRAGGADPVRSGRFGWEAHTPLQAAWLPGESAGTEADPEVSFLEVNPPNVIVQAIKPAADGNGTIVRLREIAGRDAEARVRGLLLAGSGVAARLVDLAERDGRPVALEDGGMVIPLKAFGIQSVRIVRPR